MANFREIFELPPRLYAIGDIHGCRAELEALLAHLVEGEKLVAEDVVVCIGDYVDRGPDSKGVVELLIDFCKRYPRTICLRGNHEEMLSAFLGIGGSHGDVYLQNGGEATLESYGVSLYESPEVAREKLPRDHIEFLSSLTDYVIIENYVFAHAGVNPLRDLRNQIADDLFWIRDEFINNIHHFGKTVVFGHTPYEDVLVHLPFKIGIDTGAVYGHALTCVELVSRRLIQIPHGKKTPKLRPLP